MKKTFFTSDTHFGHKNIMKYAPKTRPWETVEEMNQGLIKAWNETVGEEDVVYLLGDVSFLPVSKIVPILEQLNGLKVLVQGNHDEGHLESSLFRSQFEFVDKMLRQRIDDQDIIMCHYPIHEWDRMHRGSYHLHGHVHGHPTGIGGRILDVGWDAQGKILSMDDVHTLLKDKPIREH